jgi:hypothetical protein
MATACASAPRDAADDPAGARHVQIRPRTRPVSRPAHSHLPGGGLTQAGAAHPTNTSIFSNRRSVTAKGKCGQCDGVLSGSVRSGLRTRGIRLQCRMSSSCQFTCRQEYPLAKASRHYLLPKDNQRSRRYRAWWRDVADVWRSGAEACSTASS